MKSVLFVCHGNICRSVMAEMIMRHMVAEAGVLTIRICILFTDKFILTKKLQMNC